MGRDAGPGKTIERSRLRNTRRVKRVSNTNTQTHGTHDKSKYIGERGQFTTLDNVKILTLNSGRKPRSVAQGCKAENNVLGSTS